MAPGQEGREGESLEPDPETGSPIVPERVTPDIVKELALADSGRARRYFLDTFPTECDRAFTGLAALHNAIQDFRESHSATSRTAVLEMFFHSMESSLLNALHHFLAGFPLSSGHMMRHYIESAAMALQCADPNLDVLERFHGDKGGYPVHKAPGGLLKNKIRRSLKELLDFDDAAWRIILQMVELYDKLSHATGLALAHQMHFEKNGMLFLGGDYDESKAAAYRGELTRIGSAAESAAHLVKVVSDVVDSSQGDSTAGAR